MKKGLVILSAHEAMENYHIEFSCCVIFPLTTVYIFDQVISYIQSYILYIYFLSCKKILCISNFKWGMLPLFLINFMLSPFAKLGGGSTSSLSCIVYVVLHSYFIIHNAPDLTLLTHSCYLLYSICLSQWNQLCTITGEPREDIIWIWIAIASKLWKVQ